MILPFAEQRHPARRPRPDLRHELLDFREFGKKTVVAATRAAGCHDHVGVETFVNEFWTSRQRAAHSLHEISYRACFKPQLPRFFIERLTQAGETVYDPFLGRGTTLLEAALLGRVPAGCDINPLSRILLAPRLRPPRPAEVAERLHLIDLTAHGEMPEDLLVFYHPDTLKQICALRSHLLARPAEGRFDLVDDWIRMVAVNRLTGHSPGFFSVYTLPPNQAVSVESQRKINAQRNQVPPLRDVRALILRKTRALLSESDVGTREALAKVSDRAVILTQPACATPEIRSGSVALVVTSPPFLDVVDYAQDNWVRCWFCGIEARAVPITVTRDLDAWMSAMTDVLREVRRVLRDGGHVAFEVGEVKAGQIKLEEYVIECGLAAGLEPLLVLINDQRFTKTAQCWGVSNNQKGTNTNRIVLFRKGA
jgi:hypothetical protein